ncbi:MAG: Acetyltransferase family protein [Massilia sp.]|nr:Acetyltransferase family protein [Massilia sp.]
MQTAVLLYCEVVISLTTTIAAATNAQAPLCRHLLPAAFPRVGAAPELLVASGANGVHGVLALDWVSDGFVLHLHVVPASRRCGVGRALVAQAAAMARGETRRLRTATLVFETSPESAFLRSCGFTVTRRLLAFDTDGGRYGPTLSALLRRAGKHVPPGLTVGPLASAPAAGVAALVGWQFGVLQHDAVAKLDPRHPDPYDQQLSQVLMRDGVVVGAILGRRFGNIIEVDVNVVAPSLRHGLANLMLLEAIMRLGEQAGVQRARFSCEAHVRDTVNIGARLSAARMPDQLSYALML